MLFDEMRSSLAGFCLGLLVRGEVCIYIKFSENISKNTLSDSAVIKGTLIQTCSHSSGGMHGPYIWRRKAILRMHASM